MVQGVGGVGGHGVGGTQLTVGTGHPGGSCLLRTTRIRPIIEVLLKKRLLSEKSRRAQSGWDAAYGAGGGHPGGSCLLRNTIIRPIKAAL